MEPVVRRIVCDSLGLDPTRIQPEVSLVDELAADSLDLCEIALRLESEFGISIPERRLERVRIFGDLVALVARLIGERQRRAGTGEPSDLVWARTALIDETGKAILVRTGPMTPYDAELIAQDAARVRRVAELRVIVPGDTSDAVVASARKLFSRLGLLGIRVSVSAEGRTPERAPDQAAAETFLREDPVAVGAEAMELARELLHELQKERGLVALTMGRGRPTAELDPQLDRTARALAEVRAFLASHSMHALNPTLVHVAAAVELLDELKSARFMAADVGALIDRYSRVDARLLESIAALAALVRHDQLERSIAAYVAFACAKEDAGLEGAELAYALATESFDVAHKLALTALSAAERSCLVLFGATASPDVLAAYRTGTADPIFARVAALEREAFERDRAGLSMEGSAWLDAVMAKLDRLKAIGDIQARAIVARAAATR